MATIKKLRSETGAGVMACKKALEQFQGDYSKALEYLKQKGLEKAESKSEREIKAGLVYAYIHQQGKAGAMVEVGCETDFVARTEDFQKLCKEIAMQVVSMNPSNVEELLQQAYIRDSKQTIADLIKSVMAKVGENIQVVRFARFVIGEE